MDYPNKKFQKIKNGIFFTLFFLFYFKLKTIKKNIKKPTFNLNY